MAGTLILMMGIHGSGKSTFCELFLADGYNTVETCGEAIAVLENGEDVILDAINGSRAERVACILAAKESGCRVIGYYLDRDAEGCAAAIQLSIDEIRAMTESFEPPDLDEGFDELYRVENDGEIMAICPWGEENDEFFDFELT